MNENQIFIENIAIIIGIILFFIIAILIWLTPILCSRKNENAASIFWVNLFLGWIPIVWLILLLAALLGKRKSQ